MYNLRVARKILERVHKALANRLSEIGKIRNLSTPEPYLPDNGISKLKSLFLVQ
jgi:hypothetical protein